MRSSTVWVELKGLLVFGFSVSPLELFLQNSAKQGMGFGEPRVQVQRLSRRVNRFWTCFIGRSADK